MKRIKCWFGFHRIVGVSRARYFISADCLDCGRNVLTEKQHKEVELDFFWEKYGADWRQYT